MRKNPAWALSALGFVLGACGAPSPPRPATTSVADSTGRESCAAVESYGSPLIVDWKMEQRADLEAAMSEGVVVVHYDCHGLRMLPDCHVEGSYGFVGVQMKQQVVRLEDTREVRANLPTLGPKMAAALSAEFERGVTLDIALVVIGKRTTTHRSISSTELVGQCGEATHFIRSATIGAFAMRTGTRTHLKTVAEIFSAGVGGEMSSSKLDAQQDGSVDKCVDEPESPPKGCAAPLRLQLSPLQPPVDVGKVVEDEACPQGLVSVAGKCTDKGSDVPHLCKEDDAKDCELQCKKGHAASCLRFAIMFVEGSAGVPEDERKAVPYFQRACDAQNAEACVYLGVFHHDGRGGLKEAPAKAVQLYSKACDLGAVQGCFELGDFYESGYVVGQDEPRALALYKVACEGGIAEACNKLGAFHQFGKAGLQPNTSKAVGFYQKACDGGAQYACDGLALLYEQGSAVPKDLSRSFLLYGRGCSLGLARACGSVGRFYQAGWVVPADTSRAAAFFKRGCDGHDSQACGRLGILLATGNGVAKDEVQAVPLLRQGCEVGAHEACARLGALYDAGGGGLVPDSAKAEKLLLSACENGVRWACETLDRFPAVVAAGFNKAAAKASLSSIPYKDCAGAGTGKVIVTFAATGLVASAHVEGNYDGSTKSCVQNRFKNARVPAYAGEVKSVSWSIAL